MNPSIKGKQNILMLIGSPRSGTSLLRATLNILPSIYIAPEGGFAHFLYGEYKEFHISQLDLFLEDLYKTKKFEFWNLQIGELKDHLTAASPDNYFKLISEIYRCKALSENKSDFIYLGDKNNYYIEHLLEVNEIFRSPKFVWIVRDGRDVACSYKELMGKKHHSKYAPRLPQSVEDIAQLWMSQNENAYQFFNGLKSDQFLQIRYEDLVNESKKTIHRICDFLHINADINNSDLSNWKNDEPAEYLTWKSGLNDQLNNSKIGRYNSELSSHEITTFNQIANKALARHSYL